MTRVSVMFASVAAFLLLSGLLVRFPFEVSVHFGHVVYGLSGRATCFIAGAAFSFFAATYSLWMLPLNGQTALWHFWMTVASLAAFIAYMGILGKGNSALAWAALLCFGVFVVCFAVGQSLFVFDLTRAIYKISRNGVASVAT